MRVVDGAQEKLQRIELAEQDLMKQLAEDVDRLRERAMQQRAQVRTTASGAKVSGTILQLFGRMFQPQHNPTSAAEASKVDLQALKDERLLVEEELRQAVDRLQEAR